MIVWVLECRLTSETFMDTSVCCLFCALIYTRQSFAAVTFSDGILMEHTM